MIYTLVGAWARARHLREFEFDEILSVAYLEAERILRTRFEPDRGTATTYLQKYLFGFVQYRLLRDTGKRKTPDGWIEPQKRDPPAWQREPQPNHLALVEDLIQEIHPDLQDVARRLAQGDGLADVVDEASFDTSGEPASREDQILDLQRLLATELRRIYDDAPSD